MSTHATFYVQPCPTCGRRLRICVEYLGKSIQCRHCRAVFMARDPDQSPHYDEQHAKLMDKVEELLGVPEAVH